MGCWARKRGKQSSESRWYQERESSEQMAISAARLNASVAGTHVLSAQTLLSSRSSSALERVDTRRDILLNH